MVPMMNASFRTAMRFCQDLRGFTRVEFFGPYNQWPFQEPKLEVPTIYVRLL
jgi:hypothetical protein